ncbi:MAG TPA: SRPBCC domain-containing protein [Gammaproteobacteria bacterium]|nr:SRPBCC domain-containing protein [Gammaproteobacteria bacterium]
MKKHIYSEIVIAAPVAHVWDVLVRTTDYGDWNPFIRQIEGALEVGARLQVTLTMEAGKTTRFRPCVIRMLPGREIRWIGRLGLAGIFDGEHSLAVEPEDGGSTRFIHQETFSGVLVPFVWIYLKPRLGTAFHGMNQALKQRVENAARNDRIGCNNTDRSAP